MCTDAAAEGLNLQSADFLVNFDLPWNPAKVEQRIGRIDRIGQRHADIYVQNLCYLGSVEEIVYDRLLNRLSSMISVVGEQQISMLPVTEEDFRALADGEIDEQALAHQAEQRIAVTQQRIRETELTGQEVYEIYQRMEQQHAQVRLPVSLEGIWQVLAESPYLEALGCAVAANLVGDGREPLLLTGVPGVADGTALTIDRGLFEAGIESLGPRLRFATYGEPAFDALLALSETWEVPACVRRIAVTPTGMQNEVVAYVVAVDAANGWGLRLVTGLDDLAEISLDETRVVSEQEAETFVSALQAVAVDEFRLSAHVSAIEADNVLSAKAQAALLLGAAQSLIAGRQKYGNADANFWKELDGARAQVLERTADGGALRLLNLPGCLRALVPAGFLPFDVRPRISDDHFGIERHPQSCSTPPSTPRPGSPRASNARSLTSRPTRA